ncbi:MAG TPA: ANTAR domain-containing protein [Sporichthya sp.]|jgi:hypothetical protein|nr:ANTAR domain-containing protein [Sporichthya sp.]
MATSSATDDTHETPQLPALQERLCRLSQSLDDLEQRREAAFSVRNPIRGESFPATESLRRQVTELQAEVDGLRTALLNRGVIERAKGMLMLRFQIDEAAAFRYLREASNRTNRRLAEIAAEVVRTRAGETT